MRMDPSSTVEMDTRESEIGTLEVAKWCDLAVWDAERPAELVYRMGFNPLTMRVRRGK